MPRLVFVISGERVQNVGYRLFFLNLMKNCGLVGYPLNLSGGKHVQVMAWGQKKKLDEFYEIVSTDRPSGVGLVHVGPKMIDNAAVPQSSEIMHEKLDLLIDQTGKFVEEGKGINSTLKKLPKAITEALRNSLNAATTS